MASNRPTKTMVKRIIGMMCLFGIIALIPVVYQLVDVQLINYERYQAKAADQQTRDAIITPKRGVIYDRNMKEVAVSATVETVYISGVDMADTKDKDKSELRRKVARALSEVLGVDYDSVLKKTEKSKNYYQVIKKKIPKEESTALRQRIKDESLKGIYFMEDTKRFYPFANFASHVIGFCGDENTGLAGVEAMYEETLKGLPGRIIAAKNAIGTAMPFNYEEYHDAENGNSLVLTIDETVQQILEKHLATAVIDGQIRQRGAGIVMDVTTGEILAMATMGDFDLNQPFVLSEEEQAAIEALPEEDQKGARSNALNASWRNKIISDSYEPGSVFKILTIAMGLEEGVVGPNSSFNCTGVTRVADRNIHCWKREGHGVINLSQALEKSCNCALMEIGARVGNRKFYDYFEAFGLLEKTGIDLPGEANGYFFSEKAFTDKNNKVSLAVASFGQTFKVTPIQIMAAVSAVVNGGKLVKPHVVKEVVDENNVTIKKYETEIVRQVISESTSKILRQALEKVVAEGTGKNAYVKGYRIGGKTGTSEKIDEYVEGEKEKYIASFMGVAPMDDPKYACLIILDDPNGTYYEGSQLAAPVAGKVFSEMLPYMGLNPVYTDAEMRGRDIVMPQLVGYPAGDAKNMLKQNSYKELTVKTVGEGDTITGQIPAGGSVIPSTAQVILYCGAPAPTDKVKMPNVKGLTVAEANREITNAGLIMKPLGAVNSSTTATTATGQQYAPDTELARGTVVTVDFYATDEVSELG
ncbi:MAG: PASTA domain-containing protein [Clostridia bacterium]|nr:PASTA domain-containing protein [Clostridia bacterium]